MFYSCVVSLWLLRLYYCVVFAYVHGALFITSEQMLQVLCFLELCPGLE